MRTSLLGFGSLLAIAFNLFAAQANLTITQSESRNQGTQVVVHSATFDETRVLDIFVPDGYEHSNRDYPVIYVMDSDYLFDMTVAIAKNRWSRDLAPQSIIVGIHARNNHERFDYAMPMLRDDGVVAFENAKPEKMSAFLNHELIRYIDNQYRTNDFKVIIGMSPTSTNVVHDYLSDNPIFDAHVAIAADLQMKSLQGKPLNTAITQRAVQRKDGFIVASRAATDLQNDPTREAFFRHLIDYPNADSLGVYGFLPEQTEHYSVALSTIDFALEKLFPLAQWRPDYRSLRNSEDPVSYLKQFYHQLSEQVGFATYPTVDGYWMGNSILGLSRALTRNDKMPQAIEVLRWADQMLPENTWINHYLSRIYARMDDTANAIAFAQKAVRLAKAQDDKDAAVFTENLNNLTTSTRPNE